MQVLIKSATILDRASDHHNKKHDILIFNGIIQKIASAIDQKEADLVIDRPNLHVSMGWFDSSVSFGEPGYEHRETLANGMKVSAQSGLCHVAINPNSSPITDNKSAVSYIAQRTADAAANAVIIGALTQGSKGIDQAEMFDMSSVGCPSFYDYKRPTDDVNLLKLSLQYTQPFGGLVQSFPLERGLATKGVVHEGVASTQLGLKGISSTAETLRIQRDLGILEYTGGKLHIPTISSAGSVKLIKAAKKSGLQVSCSVAAHHLLLTDEVLEGFDTQYKVLPPLRTGEDRKALIKGLQDGTIDGVTSDHNPLDIESKKKEFDHADFGTIGLECLFGATNKALGTEAAVEALTGLREKFGINTTSIVEGQTADLSLFNPEQTWTVDAKVLPSFSKNCIYHGHTLKGKPYGVILGKKLHLNDE
ncbi:dihydroorotase [Gilvibacter sediminis]|uniref:dihydroorotase n=1 Tax=Gilvibacter sediminis TaxID=379071 RepID=UPI002350E714|nr:dihydroorotase [Gilvibacter sediminis]MDC7998230.1 dihydroorotase [Gilvibacter sediminis]